MELSRFGSLFKYAHVSNGAKGEKRASSISHYYIQFCREDIYYHI